MSKKKRESVSAPVVTSVFQTDDSLLHSQQQSSQADWHINLKSNWKKKLLYPFAGFALLFLVGMGVMAKNGWLPSTDALTGKKTGWFGRTLPQNASRSWNPMAAPFVTATPQLSKEYIYAGSRMLAVEDANANAAPPADLAIWRPSNGQWWVMGSQGSQQTTVSWGVSSDQTAPGDYDGDGKTDFAVFRESNGTWYIINSSAGDNSQTYYYFGTSDDKVAPADYDGDGKTDAALFRGSTGTWYIRYSTINQVFQAPWGSNGDIPVPGDYDGDGKADKAVYRSSNMKFYVLRSSDNTYEEKGLLNSQSGDKPIVGDYDGDGKADLAVRRNSAGSATPITSDWQILQSSNNQNVYLNGFGYASDYAVQNDYDADGKVDIAVWRGGPPGDPNIGAWYIRQSSNSTVRQAQWGIAGDIPVPAFYRR
jgi:hypothetical protein